MHQNLQIWETPACAWQHSCATGATGPRRLAVRESRGLHCSTHWKLHCCTVSYTVQQWLLHCHLHCCTASYTATLSHSSLHWHVLASIFGQPSTLKHIDFGNKLWNTGDVWDDQTSHIEASVMMRKSMMTAEVSWLEDEMEKCEERQARCEERQNGKM